MALANFLSMVGGDGDGDGASNLMEAGPLGDNLQTVPIMIVCSVSNGIGSYKLVN